MTWRFFRWRDLLITKLQNQSLVVTTSKRSIEYSALTTVKSGDHFAGYTHADFIDLAYGEFFKPVEKITG
jgi:hypothetical protein